MAVTPSIKGEHRLPQKKSRRKLLGNFLLVSLKVLMTCLSFSLGHYGNNTAVACSALKVYNTINECEEGVILTHANVLARVVNSTALTHDDVTSDTLLTAPNLNT